MIAWIQFILTIGILFGIVVFILWIFGNEDSENT